MNWRTTLESYTCEECGARPGKSCTTRTGRKTAPHAIRGHLANRCPKCNERLEKEQEPGELCERCRLIRRLEIERSTTWQRRQ